MFLTRYTVELACVAIALASSFVLGSAGYEGVQVPLGISSEQSLASLSSSQFTTLRHELFPHHSVRVKKSKFCDETVNAYTGYIDVGARHLFFSFFESRNDPLKDDVIFWTNGGPGCSSSLGLFMELGPCRIPSSNGTVRHPESWNTNANIFFIDQPIGVGFSYADHGEKVDTTEEGAKDVAAFVAIFFEHFSQFKGRAFHMAGESYAGRYLPLFASAVYDQNVKLVAAGMTPVNLQSVMIGNGMTDTFKMLLSYYDMQCTSVVVPPIYDISTCVAMKATLKRCEKWMKESCEDQYDFINCGAAVKFCQETHFFPYYKTGRNPYDMTKTCGDGTSNTDDCYPEGRQYLSKPSVRELLGVDDAVDPEYHSCSEETNEAFFASQDMLHPTKHYVAALLERGVRVLIYVGMNDWCANYIGNERFTLGLEWSGQAEFLKQELRDWIVDGKSVGKTRSFRGFTYATLYGAGHLVPYDKPKESLEMVQRWIAKQPL
ncbi:hypothetical protein D9613_001368 [Agrocybe pediades]|uniref:Carboxypeptidase n=1 Tax=Agrocybe pediades TaxID=84607 RepID=A0A8H4R5N0_9AGAR|nr:hypothetical protein D9613_001368 [Agrocybe pediades]